MSSFRGGLQLGFVYFNKKRHENELIKIKQSLDLDLQRRMKVFEMKSTQYEAYFRHIDSIHTRHKTDYQDVFMPIINKFMSSYLQASTSNDEAAATAATIEFSEQISRITHDGFKELAVIESETNSLRLTASDEVASLLEEIKEIYSAMFTASVKMMSDLVQITINCDQELANRNQAELYRLGELAKSKSKQIREQMRIDLKQS